MQVATRLEHYDYHGACFCGECDGCIESFIEEFSECQQPASEWLEERCGKSWGDSDGDAAVSEVMRDLAWMSANRIPFRYAPSRYAPSRGESRFWQVMKKFAKEYFDEMG